MERSNYESSSSRERKDTPARRAFLPMPEGAMFYQREEAVKAAESVGAESTASEKESKTTGSSKKETSSREDKEKRIISGAGVLGGVVAPQFEKNIEMAKSESNEDIPKVEETEATSVAEAAQNKIEQPFPEVSEQLQKANESELGQESSQSFGEEQLEATASSLQKRPEQGEVHVSDIAAPQMEQLPAEQMSVQREVPRMILNPFVEQTVYPAESENQYRETPARVVETHHTETQVVKFPAEEVAAAFGGALAKVELAEQRRENKTMRRRLKRFLRREKKDKINQREINKEMLENQRQTLVEQKRQTAAMQQMQERQAEAARVAPRVEAIPTLVLPTREQTYRQPERLAPQPLISAPERQPEEERLAILGPEEHRRRTAWHDIVEKHGHVVEGAIDYGEAFQREREQEASRFQQVNDYSAAGGMQSLGPVFSDFSQPTSLPSGMTTPSLPAGQSSVDPQHLLPEHETSNHNFMLPAIVTMIAIILAVFFVAAFI